MIQSHRQLEEMLTTKEAAAWAKLSQRTLEGLRMRGNGPAYVRLGGRIVRYRITDLLAWIDAGAVISTSQEAAR